MSDDVRQTQQTKISNMAESSLENSYNELYNIFNEYNQSHIFKYWNLLASNEKEILINEARKVDLKAITRCWNTYINSNNYNITSEKLKPFNSIVDISNISELERNNYYNAGLSLIASNKVGCILMAGGAGTRLGFEHPKGMYNCELPSNKTLFQLQAEKLLKVIQLAAEKFGKDANELSIPYYVMTSDGTHEETVDFWMKNNNFGIKDIQFFPQGMLPALDFDGKIIMEAKNQVSWAANGNGGIYDALDTSGAFADMKKRNIEYLHVFCVDNILVRVADPWMFGFCKVLNVDCCNKTVEKINPNEGVGCMCRIASENDSWVTSVIEYSEIPKELAEKRAADGKLEYRAANIAIHCLSIDFLSRCIENKNKLPFHVAKKKIPIVSKEDPLVTIKPNVENGIKMEMFVFDVFAFATNPYAFQVLRSEEFSPVKNALKPGATCTKATACSDVSSMNKKYLTKVGAIVDVSDETIIEIDASISYAGENLENYKGVVINTPLYISSKI